MKLKLLLLPLLLLKLYANAQQTTIALSYNPNQPGFNKDAFHFVLNQKLYALCTGKIPTHKPINIQGIKSGEMNSTIVSYALKDTSLAIFEDLFGHEVILIPGDTMKVTIGQLEKPKDILLPWYYSLTYSGKNKYIYSILDSIALSTTDVKSDMINPKGKTVDEFIRIAETRFRSRENYLKDYSIRHHIPLHIREMVYNEVYAAYVRDLVFLQSTLKSDDNSADITAILNPKIDYNRLKSTQFSKVVTAAHVVYQYLLVMTSPFKSTDFFNKNRFNTTYNLIQKDFNDEMRDDLLSRHMKQYITYGDHRIISPEIVARFNSDCKNPKFVSYIDSLLKTKQEKANLNFIDVMNSQITDLKGKSQPLKDVIAKKPTLIDCWASWCRPCIDEFPFSKELEKSYGNKINLIYLSFDKSTAAWLSKAKELNLQSTYHMPDNFESDFATFFKLNTIPRYILVDANGNLLNTDAPRPSDPRLKEIFDSL
ncbi:TlpA family protein disulfide reductase [Pedobacter africanus]|nr:TlpA disulfide reductase family protein [Pedobacter africanus]